MALPNYVHIVNTVTVSASSVALTVTNADNISENELFIFRCPKCVNELITTAPIPVTVNINGADIPIKNMYGKQILSNSVPKRSKNGRYMVDSASGAAVPYVILLDPLPVQEA